MTKTQKQQPTKLTVLLWGLSLTVHAFNMLWRFIAEDSFLNGIFGFKKDR